MDRELEEQIEDIITKATKDLKTRILRVVIRNQTKLLKDQAREFKSGTVSTARPRVVETTRSTGGRKSTEPKESSSSKNKKVAKKDDKYHSDSDSDGYYSD
jgi:hypothetical protein